MMPIWPSKAMWQCNWLNMVDNFGTNASGTTWWARFELRGAPKSLFSEKLGNLYQTGWGGSTDYQLFVKFSKKIFSLEMSINVMKHTIPKWGADISSIYGGLGPLRGRWMDKNRKKLTNVSLVCMYVGRKLKCQFFFCFFPNRSNLSTISMVA